jgi:hypothetical protein
MRRFVIAALIFLVLLQGIGLAAADEPPDYSKIVVVHLNINKSSITEKSVEMRYGHAPNLETRYGDFKGTLKSADGSTIREFNLWDPRYQLGDVLEKDNDSSGYLSGYLTYSDNADLALILPYYENQMTFELNDKKTGELLASHISDYWSCDFHTYYWDDAFNESEKMNDILFFSLRTFIFLKTGEFGIVSRAKGLA